MYIVSHSKTIRIRQIFFKVCKRCLSNDLHPKGGMRMSKFAWKIVFNSLTGLKFRILFHKLSFHKFNFRLFILSNYRDGIS